MPAYAGSFAKGFIDAFLAAQNLQMRKRHYQMMQDYYDFKMRLQGYDRASGKWINPATGKPEFDSQADYFKAMQKMFPQKSMFDGDGGDGSVGKGAYKGGPEAEAHGQEMAKYLQDQYGYSKAGAAAAVGNAWQESNFASNFAPGGDKGASKGMFQWKDDRNVAAQSWMADNHKDPNDWRSHLDFMAHEIASDPKYKSLNNILKTTDDPNYATKEFFSKFERGDPDQANMPNRVGMATKVFGGEGTPKTQIVTGPGGKPVPTTVAKTKLKPTGPVAKTSTGAPVQTDDQGRAIDSKTGKPVPDAPVATAPAPTAHGIRIDDKTQEPTPPVTPKVKTGEADTAIPSPTQVASAAQPSDDEIAMGPPDPQWSTYNAPASLKQPPPSAPPPQPQDQPQPPPAASASDQAIPSPGSSSDDDIMMSARGGMVTSKYDDGGDVVVQPSLETGSATQAGAAQMGTAAAQEGSSVTRGEDATMNRQWRQRYSQSSGGKVPSIWNLGNNIKSNLQNSPLGKFVQNPGAALSAIPSNIASNFQQSPAGQMLGYRRGGKVIKFDDGGSASDGTGGDAGGDAGFGAASAATAQGNAAGYGMGSGMGIGGQGAPAGTSTTGTGGFGDMGVSGAPSSTSDAMGTSVSMGSVGEAAAAMGPGTGYGGFGGSSARGGGSGGTSGVSGGSSASSGQGGGTTGGGAGTASGGSGSSKMTYRLTSPLAPPGGDSPSTAPPDPSIAARRGGVTTEQSAYATLSPEQKAALAQQLANIHGSTVSPDQASGLASLGPAQMAVLRGQMQAQQGGMGFPSLEGVSPGLSAAPAGPSQGAPTSIAAITAARGVPSPNAPSPNASPMTGVGPPGAVPGPGQAAATAQAPPTVVNTGRYGQSGPPGGGPSPVVMAGGHGPGGRYKGGPIRRYAQGGPVTYFANGGDVEEPIVRPDPIDYSASRVSADELSGGSSSGSAEDYETAQDDREMQQLDLEGPSESGLPLGTPQISDSFGNPSQGASDGVVAGAQSLIADNSLVTTGAIPTESETHSKNDYNSPDNKMDEDHKGSVDDAVDPDKQLSPNMRHLAAIESIYKYGVLTGHEKDGASAAGAYLKNLVHEGQDYGDKALTALKKGDLDTAVGNIVAGYHHVPDGQHMNAKVNDDGTVHVQQVDLHNKVTWEGDVGKDDLAKAAQGLKSGQAFWDVVGQTMSKYDPKDGAKVPVDPKQADYATANKHMADIEQGIQNKYFQGNNPIVNGRVAHEPQAPTPTGNAQFDSMQRQQYNNIHHQWQGYVAQNDKVAQRETIAAKADYLNQYRTALKGQAQAEIDMRQERAEAGRQLTGIQKDIETTSKGFETQERREQEKATQQAEVQRREDEKAATPLNLSDPYKEDKEAQTSQSILEAAQERAVGSQPDEKTGKVATPGIIATDANDAASNNKLFLPKKSDQNVVRDAIGEAYAHSKGNVPMDEATTAVKSMFDSDPHDTNVQPLNRGGRPIPSDAKGRPIGQPVFYQITTPGNRPFRVSSDTYTSLRKTTEAYHQQKYQRETQENLDAADALAKRDPTNPIPSGVLLSAQRPTVQPLIQSKPGQESGIRRPQWVPPQEVPEDWRKQFPELNQAKGGPAIPSPVYR
jgi:Phage tail lysozyme